MFTIFIFLLILSVLVVVHEFGHYAMARFSGMKVEEFGIGFPPKIFGFKDRHGTLWSMNAIPLGGFVRIMGEGGRSEERFAPGAFLTKSKAWRLGVLLGGVVMNLFAAWVLFSVGLIMGLPTILEGANIPSAYIREQKVQIVEVIPHSPAEKEGLMSGDIVLAIDGQPLLSGDDARAALAPHADESPLYFLVQRDNEERAFSVLPGFLPELNREGVGVAIVETGIVRYPWYRAPLIGAQMTVGMTSSVLVVFFDLITGIFSDKHTVAELSGPVGIATLTGQVVDLGLVYVVQFAAMLSVNLAVLNIIPFPALDGGRILFLFIEAIRRKPLTQRTEQMIHGGGFAFLMLLVLWVTYHDVLKLGTAFSP